MNDKPKTVAELKKNTNTISSLLEKQKKTNIITKAKQSRMEMLNKKLNGAVGTIQEVEIDKLKENPYQPRIEINPDEVKDLAESIKQKGLMQPIIVTKTNNGDIYIVAGHRRVEAHKLLGKAKVKAVFIETNSSLLAELGLIENLQREDLTLIETAMALKKYKEEFDKSYEEIGQEIGKSKSYVIKVLNVLNLPESIIKDIKENKSTKDILALNMLNSYAKKIGVNMFTGNGNADEMGVSENTHSQKWESELFELYKNFLKEGRNWLKKEIENRLQERENQIQKPEVEIKVTKKHGVTIKVRKINKEKIDEFEEELKRIIEKYSN